MSGCSACTPSDAAMPPTGWLYLWPAAPHTGPKLMAVSAELTITVTDLGSDCVRWEIVSADIETILTAASNALLPEERDGTQALLMAAGVEPGLADFRRVSSLERLIGMQRARWLSDLLIENRLETHFQPIIDARAPNRIAAYECLLRGRTTDGGLIAPNTLFGAAKQGGLLFQLDLAARRKAVQSIAEHRLSTYALINFTPTSIYDPATCLRSTVNLVRQLGLDPTRVVFEIIETEQADESQLKSILQVYRSAGFQIAIDDFGAGYSSMNLIVALRPDYLKLDMELIRGIDSDPYKAELAGSLLETARSLSIKTIAEGVETEAEWRWVQAHGADLVQGFYFARPGNPPPLLMRDFETD